MKKKLAKTEEEKEAARTRRAEAKARREDAERKEAQEVMERRREQLAVASSADDRLQGELRDIHRRNRAREGLIDHLGGFYEEIDKLAKGKAMLEVTSLVVDEANQIIRDAKALVVGDPYLDRVKEFVPAGENPVYPDVVVSVRNVRQALGRAESRFGALVKATETALRNAATIRAALELFVNHETYANKQDVKGTLASKDVIDSWFVSTPSGLYFDYDRLDGMDLGTALSADTTDL